MREKVQKYDVFYELFLFRHPLNLVVQKFIRRKIERNNQQSLDGIPEQLDKVADAIATVREYAKYFSNTMA